MQVSFLKENIKARSDLPPLLVHLCERRPEKLHYLGVSFELTYDLFCFWKRHKFAPFYICEVPVESCLLWFFFFLHLSGLINLIMFILCCQNVVTGEHTCMMLKTLDTDDILVNDELGFFGPYYRGLIFNSMNKTT